MAASLNDRMLVKMIQEDTVISPVQIINALKQQIPTNSRVTHHSIECSAHNTVMGNFRDTDLFFSKHHCMRKQIIGTKFPGISDESKTIKYLAKGLKRHLVFAQLTYQWISNMPITVAKTQAVCKALESSPT